MIKSVLVVDDDLANRMLPGLILGTEKYQVSECADGTQALKLLSEKKYDYVLLDISLPKISGIEICKIIRANRELLGMKVIAYTAHAMKAQMPKASFQAIPNAGHISNVEQPKVFNQHLIDFYTQAALI